MLSPGQQEGATEMLIGVEFGGSTCLGPHGSTKHYILLMEEMDNQLMLIDYPIIYEVLYNPGGAGFLPSTV